MTEIKNIGLDQYVAEIFEQQQFGTAGVKGVNVNTTTITTTIFPLRTLTRLSTVITVIIRRPFVLPLTPG